MRCGAVQEAQIPVVGHGPSSLVPLDTVVVDATVRQVPPEYCRVPAAPSLPDCLMQVGADGQYETVTMFSCLESLGVLEVVTPATQARARARARTHPHTHTHTHTHTSHLAPLGYCCVDLTQVPTASPTGPPSTRRPSAVPTPQPTTVPARGPTKLGYRFHRAMMLRASSQRNGSSACIQTAPAPHTAGYGRSCAALCCISAPTPGLSTFDEHTNPSLVAMTLQQHRDTAPAQAVLLGLPVCSGSVGMRLPRASHQRLSSSRRLCATSRRPSRKRPPGVPEPARPLWPLAVSHEQRAKLQEPGNLKRGPGRAPEAIPS